MRFFSYDSKFSQLVLKISYSCMLNILWFITSIPIITIGASTTALYYASLKLVRGEDTFVVSMFFKAFKENFKQSTILWLILLVIGIILGGDGYILYHLRLTSTGTPAVLWTLVLALVIAAAIAYTIILMYVFPLVASVTNTNGAMIKNAFFIGTHYLFCTILVFAVHFAMFFIVVAVFTPLIIFGEGLCALISSYFLNNVIKACSYDPEDMEEETDAAEEDAGGKEDVK